MKTGWFSPSLYREGLRRLRVVGLVTTGILTLLSLLEPFYNILVGKDTRAQFFSLSSVQYEVPLHEFFKDSDGLLPLNPFPFVAAVFLSPALVMVLFRFLNRRESSDIHHALPLRRRAVYMSLFAAALTWTAVALVASTLPWLLLMWDHVVFTTVLTEWLAALAIAVLTAGAAAFAMSMTGTPLTNVVVLLGMLLVPRMLVDLFVNQLHDQLPLIEGGEILGLLDGHYNLLTGLLFQTSSTTYFVPSQIDGAFVSVVGMFYITLEGCLYTAVLGLLYAVVGGVAFCRRRSETAGQPAPNRVLRVIYRLALPIALCVPALALILGDSGGFSGNWFPIVLFYALAVIAYFLFELLSARRVKGLWRIAPALGILVALNVAFLGGFYLCRSKILSFCPDAKEITAVRVLDGCEVLGREEYVYDMQGTAYPDYLSAMLSDIPLHDEAAAGTIADRLATTVEHLEDKDAFRFSRSYSYVSEWESGTPIRLMITCGGREYYRRLYLDDEMMALLRTAALENEEFQQVCTTLPDPDMGGVCVHEFGRATDNETREVLYDTLWKEMRSIEFGSCDMNYNGLYGQSIHVMVTVRRGGRTYGVSFFLPSDMKKTWDQYFNMVECGDQEQVIALLQSATEGMGQAVVYVYSTPTSWDRVLQIRSDMDQWRQLQEQLVVGTLDVQRSVIRVNVVVYGESAEALSI